jgi:hypothetical protein
MSGALLLGQRINIFCKSRWSAVCNLILCTVVTRDEALKCSELTVKLEPAFLAGLRCVQPAIRAKFFEVFDASMKRRLHDRLMYIICSQNWEAMGPHYWIKQCIELLVVTASPSKASCYLYETSLCNTSQYISGVYCLVLLFFWTLSIIWYSKQNSFYNTKQYTNS